MAECCAGGTVLLSLDELSWFRSAYPWSTREGLPDLRVRKQKSGTLTDRPTRSLRDAEARSAQGSAAPRWTSLGLALTP